jgi:hypothetical protein
MRRKRKRISQMTPMERAEFYSRSAMYWGIWTTVFAVSIFIGFIVTLAWQIANG